MTATIIKAGGALTVVAVTPPSFKTYKERVYDNGGIIANEDYCASALALAAKYGISSGFAVSPSWGIRYLDDKLETLYGLFENDVVDPYVPLSSTSDVALGTYESYYGANITSTTTLPACSANIVVTTSLVSMVAVRSANPNTATEGYLLCIGQGADAAYRMSVSNEPTGGSSRLRTQCGPSIRTTVYGATKASLARWKVSGLYASAAALDAIEDGAVYATSAPGANFKAATYKARIGFDATNGGGVTANPVDAWIGEAWVIPDASAAFSLALAAAMSDRYE